MPVLFQRGIEEKFSPDARTGNGLTMLLLRTEENLESIWISPETVHSGLRFYDNKPKKDARKFQAAEILQIPP